MDELLLGMNGCSSSKRQRGVPASASASASASAEAAMTQYNEDDFLSFLSEFQPETKEEQEQEQRQQSGGGGNNNDDKTTTDDQQSPQRNMGLIDSISKVTMVSPPATAISTAKLLTSMAGVLDTLHNRIETEVDLKKAFPVFNNTTSSMAATSSTSKFDEKSTNLENIFDATCGLNRLNSFKGIMGQFLLSVCDDNNKVDFKKMWELVKENGENEFEEATTNNIEYKEEEKEEDDDDDDVPEPNININIKKRKRSDDNDDDNTKGLDGGSKSCYSSSCSAAAVSAKTAEATLAYLVSALNRLRHNQEMDSTFRNLIDKLLTEVNLEKHHSSVLGMRCNCQYSNLPHEHVTCKNCITNTKTLCVSGAMNLASKQLEDEHVFISNNIFSDKPSDESAVTTQLTAFLILLRRIIHIICQISQILLNGYDFGGPHGLLVTRTLSKRTKIPKVNRLDTNALYNKMNVIRINTENLTFKKLLKIAGCINSAVVSC